MHPSPLSARALTASYAFALLVIAGLSIGSHIVLDRGLESNRGGAAIVNQTGRQRMLSQRIAGLAAEYRLGDATAREALDSAIAEFETSHEDLVLAVRANPANDEEAQQLQALYLARADPLDAEARAFIADARAVANLSPSDPAMSAPLSRLFIEARSPMLAALEKVVAIEQRKSEAGINRLKQIEWTILLVVLFALAVEAIAIFAPMIRTIVAYTRELVLLATLDPLTGAPNRRAFLERCESECHRARRFGGQSSLIMLDIDHFKRVNDVHGHGAGDEVLKNVARVLRDTLRKTDVFGRLGGEEFAILLVGTDLPGASRVAELIRTRLEQASVQCGRQTIRITASLGITLLLPDALDRALHVADALMYQAKQAGRNRFVVDATPGSRPEAADKRATG